MANQYFVVLDSNLEPIQTLEFTGGYEYINRTSVILYNVLDQVLDPVLNGFEPPVTIDFDNNTLIPPPNTTGTSGWQDPNPVADVMGEWVDNYDTVQTVTESIEFYNIDETYVIVDAQQPLYTESDVVTWAKQVTLWWLWDTHKEYVDIWHMLISPTMTLAQLNADYETQYQLAQNATTIAELQAITLIYPH